MVESRLLSIQVFTTIFFSTMMYVLKFSFRNRGGKNNLSKPYWSCDSSNLEFQIKIISFSSEIFRKEVKLNVKSYSNNGNIYRKKTIAEPLNYRFLRPGARSILITKELLL